MKYLIPLFIFFIIASPVLGANTYTADFESSSSQYASITDASQTGLAPTGDFSISFHLNLESISLNTTYGLFYKDGADGNRGYGINLRDTGGNHYLRMYNSSDGSNTNTTANIQVGVGTLSTNTWYHFVIIYDASAGQIEVYKDNVSQGTGNGLKTSTYQSTASFHMGANQTPANYIDGKIDEVAFFDTLLDSNDVDTYYDCGLVGTETNLVALWKMENDLTDDDANGNDLTNNNTITFQSASLPFTDDCGGAGTSTPGTATSTIDVGDLRIFNDITIVSGYTEIYTDSTTTPSEIRHTVYHIPFFLLIYFSVIFVWIAGRLFMELLIRWRA